MQLNSHVKATDVASVEQALHQRELRILLNAIVTISILLGPLLDSVCATEAERLGSAGIGLTGTARNIVMTLWPHLAPIIAGFANIPRELGEAWAAVFAEPGLWTETGRAAVVIAGMLLAVVVVRQIVGKSQTSGPSVPAVGQIMRRFLVDVSGVLALIVAAALGGELLLSDNTLSAFLGLSLVEFLVRFQVARVIVDILYRPGDATLRLMASTDAQVRAGRPHILAALFFGIGFPALIPVFVRAGMDWNAAQALAILMGTLTALLGLAAAWRFFLAHPPIPRWHSLIVPAAAAFWLAWCYGVISLDFPFFFAIVKLGTILVAALMVDRIIVVSRKAAADPEAEAESETQVWRRIGAALRRIAHILALAFATAVIVGWAASYPSLVAPGRAAQLEASVDEGVMIFCLGYILFEGLTGWMHARFSPRPTAGLPGLEDDEAAPASRLATVMPLLIGVVGVTLLGITTLIALTRIGINVTPILAGAGIMGLAVSFGSQSLVRDIVAGIFYMIDDAFRLGEYIEANRLKGTVERISLRSVRLRHHNGHIHTIPFGQMGSITNFSRDWITIKFNLRLSRDVDVDVVRKAVKVLGQDMLADEEYGKEFIQPLKFQGIADILENALIMRFKFTVRPGKPSTVQREAVKRMVKLFAEKGIGFAQNSVVVQRASAMEDSSDDAAAAASITSPTIGERSGPSR